MKDRNNEWQRLLPTTNVVVEAAEKKKTKNTLSHEHGNEIKYSPQDPFPDK